MKKTEFFGSVQKLARYSIQSFLMCPCNFYQMSLEYSQELVLIVGAGVLLLYGFKMHFCFYYFYFYFLVQGETLSL